MIFAARVQFLNLFCLLPPITYRLLWNMTTKFVLVTIKHLKFLFLAIRDKMRSFLLRFARRALKKTLRIPVSLFIDVASRLHPNDSF